MTQPPKNCWRWYTPKERHAFAELAQRTSIEHVIRTHGCSYTAVRHAMRIHGITPRRPGVPSKKVLAP